MFIYKITQLLLISKYLSRVFCMINANQQQARCDDDKRKNK